MNGFVEKKREKNLLVPLFCENMAQGKPWNKAHYKKKEEEIKSVILTNHGVPFGHLL